MHALSPITKDLPFSDLVLPENYLRGWKNLEPEPINLYEGSPASTYPGGSNILSIPSDLYYTKKALIESMKRGDREEIADASIRLFGIPANIISTIGTIISYGKSLGMITYLPLYLTPITLIAGFVLCIAEGLVDIFSLNRQKSFESDFDFELLSYFKNLTVGEDLEKTVDAIEKITNRVNKDLSIFNAIIGGNQAIIVQTLLNNICQQVKENPESLPLILNHYHPALEEISKQLLVDHLEKIRDRYLLIGGHEKEVIKKRIKLKNPKLGKTELVYLQKKELETASIIKKKQLARRVRPWMTLEATKIIDPLLKEIISEQPGTIHEGLKFIDDLHAQSKKKKIVHTLGIIALVFAAISLIVMGIFPTTIPAYILAGIAMTFSFARAGVFYGTLSSRGWSFEPKKILPWAIRRRIFSDPKPEVPPISQRYAKELTPKKQQGWTELFHIEQLNLNKSGFESFQKEKMSEEPIRIRQLFV